MVGLVLVFPTPGITNRHRSRDVMDRPVQHRGKFVQAGRRKDCHPWNGFEESRIKQAVVGLTVVPHQTGTVHTKNRMEMVNGDIMN